jgi:serine/threonine-protein kinase PknG
MSMTVRCAACGEASTELDYCSNCGHKLDGAAAIGLAAGSGLAVGLGAPSTRSTRSAPTAARSARSGRTAQTARSASVRGLVSTRGTRTSRTSSRRLGGAGVVPLPPLPPLDPVARLIEGVVPERRRICSGLQESGAPCNTKLSREAGFCPMCGTSYDFRASLKPDDLLDNKYEIKGPIAYGGLGWIYLAWDRYLSRWCVLKGLINSNDPTLEALAQQESQFLASLNHPNVVQVYTFLRNRSEGYIVMGLVNGKNLLQIRREHGGPLPVPLAISYILNILPAFGYLDSRGLIFMDMKLENVMVEDDGQGNTVEKLIDLGAVRRIDDKDGDLFATVGYAAPEVSANPPAPTPVSDLYSVGRALALLVCDFPYQDGPYEFELPPPDQVPVFAEHESLYRFLTRATAEAPDARFQTAEEMAQQLLGVLREEVAGTAAADEIGAYQSALFEADANLGGDLWGADGRTNRSLPALRVDPFDRGATTVLASLAIADPERRLQAYTAGLANLAQTNSKSPGSSRAVQPAAELRLRSADLLIERGDFAEASAQLAGVEQDDPYDWRVAWYRGKLLLAQSQFHEALAQFDVVLGEVPGELAPKLAIGLGYELAGEADNASIYYATVAQTDPQLTAAAFGLARAQLLKHDRGATAAALARVSSASIRYAQARLAMARVLLGDEAQPPSEAELEQAAEVIEGLTGLAEGISLHEVTADLYRAVAEALERDRSQARSGERLLGVQRTSAGLRAGAERELRLCAQFARDRAARVVYVDRANRVRPRTLW